MASIQSNPDDESRSWLTYLTPLTVVVLGIALFSVVRPGAAVAPTQPVSIAERRPYVPPPRLRAPMTVQPYVMVLVSTPEDALTAPQLVKVPDAYIDIRVVATAEDRRALADILIEIRSMRLPAMLSEPIVLDARKF